MKLKIVNKDMGEFINFAENNEYMNQLLRHIEYLLQRHDCVIVPGLGAFIVTSYPARIDRETLLLSPPCRSIMFNQAVTTDDGVLATSFARSLSVTFEEARQIIQKDVADAMTELNSQRTLEIGNIGKFILGEEDKILFSPSQTPESLSVSLGLPIVSLASSLVKTPHTVSTTVNKESEVLQERVSYNDESNDDNNYYQFKINRTLIKISAIFLLFLAVALAVLIYPVPHDSREQRASVVPVEAILPVMQPSKEKQIEEAATTEIEQKELTQNQDSFVENPDSPVHYLIVATFSSKGDAEKYVELNNSSEFPLETVSSKKVTRVSVASSNSKEQLLQKLNSQTIKGRFPNSWIWSSASNK